MSYGGHFSFFTFFSVSRHIPGLTRGFSHFPCWSVFLPYFRSYSVHFSFSRFSLFLLILRSYSVCVSFYMFFSSLAISMSYSVHFSFFTFFSVSLVVFHNLPREFLIFLVCQVSRHSPGRTVLVTIFLFGQFSHHISAPTLCVSHYPPFSVFSIYPRS